MTAKYLSLVAAAALCIVARPLAGQSPALPLSQDQSATELYRLVRGLTVTPRVLVIGMHPDDEDTPLIAWLSRGRNVQTAYLSITRGEAAANFGGDESGSAIGAIQTQELLAARRIDGAQQFFTRAYDFGFARTPEDVFKHWARDSIVGDIVAVIRAFRPQVIVAPFSESRPAALRDGQHDALRELTREAIIAAADSHVFPPAVFGTSWQVAKLYVHGAGIRIDANEFDRVLGKTYAAIAMESRSQHRSQGLSGVVEFHEATISLHRDTLLTSAEAPPDRSLFDGVDTTFARLIANAPPDVAAAIPLIAAYADSARRALDLSNPPSAVQYLAQVARLATSARAATPWCHHPSASAAPPAMMPAACEPAWLDLDASIDLVRERSTAALLAAASISFEATADREFVAGQDRAVVLVTMFNHGTVPATLADVAVWGSAPAPVAPVIVPPDSAAHVFRLVTNLVDSHPWWLGMRKADRFAAVPSSLDGLARGVVIPAPLSLLGVAVPENTRRTSDATVTVTVAGATVTTSLGPVIYRYADAQVGVQNRPLAGMPDVTLQFERPLEWIPRGKPITRAVRVAIKSYSDQITHFSLRSFSPNGIHVDSLPAALRLEPREQRELFVQIRGRLDSADRDQFALVGRPIADDPTQNYRVNQSYQTGFQTVQRSYLPPIRFFRTSGVWIQPVDIEVPPKLTVIYVPGLSDETTSALKQVNVAATEVSADLLLQVDLSKVTTVAIGPRAFEAHPELATQAGRLLEFVRNGGTLVVQRGDNALVSSRLFPFPITLARPVPERVTHAEGPVVVADPGARLLNWPNKIGAADWNAWVGERAQFVPSVVDPRYARLIEAHDPGEKENHNAILVAHVGKGTLIYTTLTLEQQIAGGVPGALRLLVNMLSAGMSPLRP